MTEYKAQELAAGQREIGVAEFFARNRHLLGFDNKIKALMTTIKEAVDNALDACEEAEILPEVVVEIIDMGDERFKVIVEDNGPGIVKEQIPRIFAKLLYGSKFHKLRMSRGQQGIGISASVLYGQLTTGRPAKITSKIGATESAHYYELTIDTKTNEPKILKDQVIDWPKEHGTRVEIDLEASYQKGMRSVDTYLKQTAIVNPHVTIIYTNPKAEQLIFPRATDAKPLIANEIKPHPYGVELGALASMLEVAKQKSVSTFLQEEFTRVSPSVAKEICQNAAILPDLKPQKVTREQVESLIKGIKKTKIMAPPTDCIAPIGEELLIKGLKKEINAEFYAAVTRSPDVYRGNPFVIEVAIAYGGEQPGDQPANLMRFANRVPLLYQQGACAAAKSVSSMAWRNYGLQQSKNALPIGPITIAVHIASVWVPFTSESKEAIAHYPEILKEMRLALQELGRKLGSYVNKKKRVGVELKKRSYIQKYMPHISESLIEILELPATEKEAIEAKLLEILEKDRGKLDTMEFDASANDEFDEEFASIGKKSKKKGSSDEDDFDDTDGDDGYSED
jgi:DNA topoisomerase VI subunit B